MLRSLPGNELQESPADVLYMRDILIKPDTWAWDCSTTITEWTRQNQRDLDLEQEDHHNSDHDDDNCSRLTETQFKGENNS